MRKVIFKGYPYFYSAPSGDMKVKPSKRQMEEKAARLDRAKYGQQKFNEFIDKKGWSRG